MEPTKKTVEWGRILGLLVGSRKVLSDAGAIICVGYDEYQAIQKQYPSSYVEYLPNGVDIARFAKGDRASFRKRFNIPEQSFVLLTVARIDVQKNQLGLVKQLSAIRKVVPNVQYVCLGHVTNEGYLQSMQKEAELAEVADALTVIPGLAYDDPALVDAYHAADCFVLPSLHEPFGMVVLEAWASGLPVAVSRQGGLATLVEQNLTGLFFDPQAKESDQQSMKESICSLALDASLRRRLASSALKKAQEMYSWDRITDRLEEIYRRVYEHTVS
ncbi:MAG: glycosyltransferase family 1 protein [Spirochaetia bacterium]|nr:glycosyltransferase family 1 protein [Spirochaetia bacterium]